MGAFRFSFGEAGRGRFGRPGPSDSGMSGGKEALTAAAAGSSSGREEGELLINVLLSEALNNPDEVRVCLSMWPFVSVVFGVQEQSSMHMPVAAV